MMHCWGFRDLIVVFVVGCHMPMVVRALKEYFGFSERTYG